MDEFTHYENEIDAHLYKEYGTGIDFMPDWNSRDAFNEGMTPKEAAKDWWEYAQESY